MTNVALVTAPDEGAAELIASALELRGIPFEIVPQVNMVYLGGATRVSLEVRVPAERLHEARAALEQLEEESPGSSALAADAGALPAAQPDESERGDEDAPDEPPPARRPRLWLGVPISAMVPFPIGLLYSRHPRLGWLLFSASATSLAVGFINESRMAFMVWMVLKAFDVVTTPLLVARANRAAGGRDSVALGAALSLLFAASAGVGGFAWWQEVAMERQEAEATRLFNRAFAEVNRGVDPRGDDGTKLRFPDIPLGRMYSRMIEYRKAYVDRTTRAQRFYASERADWEFLRGQPDRTWLDQRSAGTVSLQMLLNEEAREESSFVAAIDREADYDDLTRRLADRVRDEVFSARSPMRGLRTNLRALADTWASRAWLLGIPPRGTEEDRTERQRLADQQREQTARVDTLLRGPGE